MENPTHSRKRPTGEGTIERAEIDRGAARDKIAFPDPAVAGFETDGEAAGTPMRDPHSRSLSHSPQHAPKRTIVWGMATGLALLSLGGIAVAIWGLG
jgi:hypothetical protein